jgi:hypothetical protein
MTTKTLLIIAALSVGGCCLFGTGLVVLGALVSDDAPVAAAAGSALPTAGGNPKLGGYVIFGRSTPVADGFAESLEGNWLLIDGASVESIESIHSDHVVVKTSRTGELWHFTFESDGSYAMRYLITSRIGSVMFVEKGDWTSNGAQLTLTPDSCTEKAPSETTDCLESGARTYSLSTVQMDELTANDQPGATWKGVRFTGPFPKYMQGPNPYPSRDLQRVQ